MVFCSSKIICQQWVWQHAVASQWNLCAKLLKYSFQDSGNQTNESSGKHSFLKNCDGFSKSNGIWGLLRPFCLKTPQPPPPRAPHLGWREQEQFDQCGPSWKKTAALLSEGVDLVWGGSDIKGSSKINGKTAEKISCIGKISWFGKPLARLPKRKRRQRLPKGIKEGTSLQALPKLCQQVGQFEWKGRNF